MSTISKERLEQLASGNAWVCVQDDEAAELARIALASLEAEAVCYLTWHQGFRAPDDCEEYVVEANPGDKSCDGSPAFPVYAAPPAPVSVNITRDQIRDIFMRNGFTIKDGQTDLKDYVYAAADELVSLLKTQAPVSVPDAMEMDDDFDSAFEHGKAVGWNAYRAAMLQGADRPQNEPQNIPENIPATQFKPVADLYGLTSPTGSETSFTFDAVEARDFIDGGWSCQEYVELERFQEAITNHTEDKLAMVDHSGDSNNMVEPVTTAYKLPPHIFRELVNRLRDTAVKYQGCQQLREQLSRTLQEVIQPAAPQQEVKP